MYINNRKNRYTIITFEFSIFKSESNNSWNSKAFIKIYLLMMNLLGNTKRYDI